MSVLIRPFAAGDVVQLALQPSQHVTLGFTRPVHNLEDGRELAEGGPAWTAIGGGRILCCAGFKELFPAGEKSGGHAVAWALLATGLGAAHVAVTRFAREQIRASSYSRIEAIARAHVAAECKWPRLLGMKLAATLRAWGPDGETHLLFERIRGEAPVPAPSNPTGGRAPVPAPSNPTGGR